MRSTASGNSVTMIARITDAWAAAPTPWSSLAPISSASVEATPQSSDATVNVTRPARNMRRRPRRSPRRPARSSRLPNVTRKALTTHVRLAWLKPRSCWIAGSATFTIVTSRTIISCARQTTTGLSIDGDREARVGGGHGALVAAFVRIGRSEITGGHLQNYTEAPSGLSIPICHEHHRASHRALLMRPKRADARRNYEKVLAAAREAFAEGGESTALEEIARRAGVGIGTLYRHFPNRQALVEALYVGEVDEICRSADALEDVDPWEALSSWFERFIGYIATKQALANELLNYLDRDAQLFKACRTSLWEAGEPLLRRAQEAGAVRPDVSIGEVMQMVMGIAKIPTGDPAQTQQILRIALDGLRYRPEA